LVIHEPYRGVKLTEKGRKIALNVLRRHRLAERLLTDILHLDWSEAHEAACKLEHALPADVIKPLEKTLGHPKTCPHGNPIPTACGGIIEQKSEPLVNLSPKVSGIIVKIIEEKAEVLQHLATLGLKPGVCVEVEKKASFGDPVTIKVGEASHALDYKVASIINVKRTDGKMRDDDGVTFIRSEEWRKWNHKFCRGWSMERQRGRPKSRERLGIPKKARGYGSNPGH